MTLEGYVIERLENHPEPGRIFESVVSDPDCEHEKEITNKVRNKEAELYRITDKGKIIGHFALEIEGKTLWVLGAVLTENHKLFFKLEEMFYRTAQRRGCDFLMFSTARPGLIELALSTGFRVSKINLRKTVNENYNAISGPVKSGSYSN